MISSMLEALKRLEDEHQSAGVDEMSGKPAATAIEIKNVKPIDGDDGSDLSDMLGGDDLGDMADDQGDDGDDAAQNAAIVDVLQSQYPDIYSKISKSIGGDDESADQSSGGPSVSAY